MRRGGSEEEGTKKVRERREAIALKGEREKIDGGTVYRTFRGQLHSVSSWDSHLNRLICVRVCVCMGLWPFLQCQSVACKWYGMVMVNFDYLYFQYSPWLWGLGFQMSEGMHFVKSLREFSVL